MKHKFNQSAHQRLLQKMALTPQMRQSIQILGMSAKDLGEYIDSIIAQNPFLQKLIDKKAVKDYSTAYTAGDGSEQYNRDVAQSVNPRDGLLGRLRMLGIDKKTQEIAEYLIYEMDDNGYIKTSSEDAAADLAVDAEEVEECVSLIQTMDPPGIGSRDIIECLQLQLKRAGKEDSLEYEIVSSFLNDVARNDIEKIQKALEADKDKVRAAVENVRRLNPRPAANILSEKAERVIPELIAKINDNKVNIEINRGSLPRLKLYNPYEKELDIIKDPEARRFMKENMDVAKKLMDNLKRREETVCKVADYILNFQRHALAAGEHNLKSLTIREIAAALDFHPSTISRTVSNKYIQINDKVMPLNNLLSHGIKKDNGEVTSKTAVKNKIASLIKNEDKSHPLSDGAIMEILKREGIVIERRTVAKYRAALKMLPTHLRKKVKSAD